ncbi:SRPBCC family protein [Bradyrhizobium erythrophlei]|uniref:Uncharacterized conserved protein YndB, AHSA1/START domain n=1 Tax=Bradyrhizobium erythrophlei TaxID=1437360 RepID=A0A1M5IAT7_9BRAD|nr:SRPBCC family protein [Bradyrhizobium erythrophlei]SHG25345.1 Uncharacterized conserved protein YndB, AHSA1/START domain [Bradyrhizobium erythrophlei]
MPRPEFIYVTYIETTPEKLWEALTSSDFTKRYWWDTRVVSDWKVGSPFSLVLNGRTTDVGEVLEAERPRRLSYTFRHILNEAARNERPSRVTFVLEPHGKLVKLTLTHEDFAEDSVVIDGISKGWPAIMSSLKSLLESGEALVIPLDALFIDELEEAYRS